MGKHYSDKGFGGVAMLFIIIGAIVFTIGVVSWLYNVINSTCGFITFPGFKSLAGLLVMGFGYVILELELIRQK